MVGIDGRAREIEGNSIKGGDILSRNRHHRLLAPDYAPKTFLQRVSQIVDCRWQLRPGQAEHVWES